MFKSYLVKNLLQKLEKLEYGILTVITPEKKEYLFGENNSDIKAKFTIHNWSFLQKLFTSGDIGFAECYRDKIIDCDNLTNFLIIFLKNAHIFNKYLYTNSLYSLISKIRYYLNRNTIKGSKKNIHYHYDIGNDFYSLWLDKSMTYSSGIFQNNQNSLHQAQINKYDRILDLIGKSSGNLLEIGCGWGGFINHALEKKDFKVKGITISNKQFAFASEKIKKNASIALEDYRTQYGNYDYIVSIEMFEAVGEKYWSHYFNKIKSLLNKKGKAVIQTIVIDEKYFEKYKKTADMIRSFIFPGGMLPSFKYFQKYASQAGLDIKSKFNFGQDYAETIKYWLVAFEDNIEKIKTMNLDEKFIRIWRLYLSACIAGFIVKRTDVMQIELSHA